MNVYQGNKYINYKVIQQETNKFFFKYRPTCFFLFICPRSTEFYKVFVRRPGTRA